MDDADRLVREVAVLHAAFAQREAVLSERFESSRAELAACRDALRSMELQLAQRMLAWDAAVLELDALRAASKADADAAITSAKRHAIDLAKLRQQFQTDAERLANELAEAKSRLLQRSTECDAAVDALREADQRQMAFSHSLIGRLTAPWRR